MKTRTLIFITIFLLSVNFLFAEDVKTEISEEEFLKAFSGTWDFVSKFYRFKKIVNYPDGSYEEYLTEESKPSKGGIKTIEEKRKI